MNRIIDKQRKAHRIEGGAVDGKQSDLIDLGPENGELGAVDGEGEARIAGGKLNVVEEEIIP